jgi:predicted RND superfamily exporter protein
MAKRSFYARFAWPILIAHFVLIPVACVSAIRAVKSNKNDVSDWLPASYDETIELGWFRKHFVADSFVLISWDGAKLGEDPSGKDDDPRIAKLVDELKKARFTPPQGGADAPVFRADKITTGRTVLTQLMGAPSNMGRKKATDRLQGSLIGPDGKQTVIMATLSEAAAHNLRESIGRPKKRFGLISSKKSPFFQALENAGLSEEEVRLGGPPVDNNAIDEEGENSLVRLAGLAGLLGFSLAYYSLRSFRMTMVVFMCGVFSAALSLAIVKWSGFRMDAILMSMPALIYVLAVSGAVHITNYYRQAVVHHGFEGAVERAIKHAWKPALLCSITTGIGLAALHTSQIIPIAKFGDFSAVGVFAMLIILFLFLPATLKLWPWTPPEMRGKSAAQAMAENKAQEYAQDHMGERWVAFGAWVDRHHNAVAVACFLLIGVLCLGLPRVKTSIDLLKLFDSDARLLADYRWFEDNLGRIVPMELVLRFPDETRAEAAEADNQPAAKLVARHTFLDRVEMVGVLERALKRRLGAEGDDLIGATMSVQTFTPTLGEEKKDGTYVPVTPAKRYVTNENLLKARTEFEGSGFLRTDEDNDNDELWRVSVRVGAFSDVDQGEVVSHVREAVEPVLTARSASVTALKRLASARGGQPSGAHVIFWAPDEVKSEPSTDFEDPAPFLTTKGVNSQRLMTLPSSLSSEEFDRAAGAMAKSEKAGKLDGVILGPGFTENDKQRLRTAGVTILAVYDVVAKDRAEALVTEKQAGAKSHDVNIVYTGAIPVVYKAQRELLNSLIQSTCWSFGTITPLMMYVCGGVLAGLVVILPNALPVLVVFGGMGWLGISVDIGSMMAASIALGVAVDDTIHFLAWFRDDFNALGNRRDAVLSAYRRSATATLQAALINGLGLSVFATSSFTPTKRFGWLMLAILIAGMVAELIMCPSLLFGPMGKVFEKKDKKGAKNSGTEDDHGALMKGATGSSGAAGSHENGSLPIERPHSVREPHASAVRRQA